tara:strand:- start:1356 stop:2021 length:666 start_codon:yes stop_codon:yes gene_type:complete
MSERLLGAVVASHGDDKGLVMPPSVAPIQVVVVPIIAKNDSSNVISESERITNELKSRGIRARLDSRDIRPGQKYYDWEIKGVPLRIEIGPRDLANHSVMCARRTGGKESHPMENLADTVHSELEAISSEMNKRSSNYFNSRIKPLPNFKREVSTLVFDQEIEKGIVYEMAFDGNDAEAEIIEKNTNLSFLGDSTTPFDSEVQCCITGNKTRRRVLLAKTY